jgi:hypothetical protein
MKVVITGTLQKIISQAELAEIIKQCSGSQPAIRKADYNRLTGFGMPS